MDADGLIPSSERPLQVRARLDLIADRQTFQGRTYWVIKDPLTMKYFRFEDEEYFILQSLDGRRCATEILDEFHQRFAPYRLTQSELFRLIGTLHRSGLLISDRPGQGPALWKRGLIQSKRLRRQQWLNILSWRFRGVDPDRFLAGLCQYFGWFFSWPVFCLVAFTIVAALGIVVTNWSAFYQRLPQFHQFFAGSNWIWLAAALSGTKIIHELGHGLACKRFGCQCHELGIMFLVFTPCLYCNVSDAWMLPSKWRRIAISAAGMYVELFVAALATFVWWLSEPGLIHQLALNVMFVSSVSTLVFNANPLMRFDGYYILSDWIEVPNLRQKANSLVQRWLAHWCLGIESRPDPFLPTRHQWLFASYAFLAIGYRWLITLSIVWFLYHVLEPYGLQIIGQGLAGLALYTLIGLPMQQAIRYLWSPGRWAAVKTKRLAISGLILIALLMAIMCVPLPHDVSCSCFLEVAGAQSVFIEQGGIVAEIAATPNARIAAGDLILRLTNLELVRELRRMETEIRVAAASYQTQLNLAQVDPMAQSHVNTALATHNAAVDRFQQRLNDLPKLEIVAPCHGWLISPPPRRESLGNDELGAWTGRPLDARQIGAYFEPQTLVAMVAPNPEQLDCFLAIDQADVEFVAAGQPVKIWLAQARDRIIHGVVKSISLSKLREAPRGLSHRFGGSLTTQTAADGREIPVSATYPALVEITARDGYLLHGATGQAKIRVGYRTIANRLWRVLCQTFRFDLR